jgi:MazG family protein
MRLTRRGGAGSSEPEGECAQDGTVGSGDAAAGGAPEDAAPTPAAVERAPSTHREHGLRPGLDGLRDLVDRLLAEDGCPWDRAQTLDTLRPYLLEEAHEVLEAMHDARAHRAELGDLLFQIVLHAALRERAGDFDLDRVIDGIVDKMIRRHPHVFGDASVRDSAEVLRNWARIKSAERAAKGAADDASILSGLPPDMPALHAAHRVGEKASRVGFDWPNARQALAKVREEVEELDAALAAGGSAAIEHELGDLLFAVASVARLADQHGEMALRSALARFTRRFRAVEDRLRARGLDVHAVGTEALETLWEEVKREENAVR